MKVIATAHNGFHSKFGVPRQTESDSVLLTRIVFTPEYRVGEALRGIEAFSHLWLIWGFETPFAGGEKHYTEAEWSPTVRPPRLGGNTRVGVFATRSPNRPNRIALSSVRLLKVEDTPEGKTLLVQGADMMDGTPIYDIKPYLPYTDCHPDATGGFTDAAPKRRLRVVWENEESQGRALKSKVESSEFERSEAFSTNIERSEAFSTINGQSHKEIEEIIAADPRPAYHNDAERIYAFDYADFNIRFKVEGNTATILHISCRE